MEILKEKIPKHIFDRLEAAEICTLDYFLLKSKLQICDQTKLTLQDVSNIRKIVSEIVLNSQIRTALDLKEQKEQWKVINTGCPVIDSAFKGIPVRGITEIYGESGSGKTQLALQLALQVQKSEKYGGLNAGTVYICTEDNFPSNRLQQMSQFLPKCFKENTEKSFSDEVFIEHIQDIEQLKYCITIRIPVLLSRTKIKLIVIDSIAAVFRYDNELCDYISRAEDLQILANKLNSLSIHYNLAAVCINQVTSDPQKGEKPCLGLAWSNLVRTRIRLQRCNINVSYKNKILSKRKLEVIFSPETPKNECYFVVTTSGVFGINS